MLALRDANVISSVERWQDMSNGPSFLDLKVCKIFRTSKGKNCKKKKKLVCINSHVCMREQGQEYKKDKREKAITKGNLKLSLARPKSKEEQVNNA